MIWRVLLEIPVVFAGFALVLALFAVEDALGERWVRWSRSGAWPDVVLVLMLAAKGTLVLLVIAAAFGASWWIWRGR